MINEVSSSDSDPVELKNISNSAVELSGWKLSDRRGAEAADLYTLYEGAKIAAGSYIVLNKNDHFSFGLGGDDAVALADRVTPYRLRVSLTREASAAVVKGLGRKSAAPSSTPYRSSVSGGYPDVNSTLVSG